ncbi:MAG: PD40 domain-containing protein [Gammaproteobacteria bacterium]|nr:PD40 domain-containing protein [Gammaproteobacteria bacterium]
MQTKWINKLIVMFAVLVTILTSGSPAYADGSGPMSPFPITGAYTALARPDRDHISVIEFGGNYDKSLATNVANVEPRAVIAREFFRTHPDNYDFLVVFSSFEFNTGDALAFEWMVQNKVQGIGLTQFDNSALFGSQGKLQGFIDMAALTRYQTDPINPNFDDTLGVLAHEMLHQWGSYVHFKQADGSISSALLGRQDAHWSFLLNSNASVEYGAQWRDNGNGTFSAVGTRTFFSPLDLYLMGFYKAAEVPPFTLIDNPTIDKTQLPQLNVTVSGTPRTISINDIIGAEGARVPDATTAQKEFRLGFVFLVGPNDQVSDAQILALNNIRNAFMTRFAILTAGRAVAQVYPQALSTETTGTPGTVIGSGARTTPANLDEGLAWLRSHQTAQGYWNDKDTTRQRDTTIALATLSKLDGSFSGSGSALSWLNQNPSPNTDYLARQASLLADIGQNGSVQRDQLVTLQNSDGGWGLGAGYQSNALDSALAVLALAGHGVTPAVLDKAGQYLLAAQNSDGGWGSVVGGPSRSSVTATVLRALKAINLPSGAATTALAFLKSKQNPDGGFGDSPSTVHDTANVLQAAIAIDGTAQILPDAAAAYLMSRQGADGSWDGSVYATAVAVSTLKQFNYPNWNLTGITATPTSVNDGDRVKLSIYIKNDSNLATPAGVLRVYDGDPASGGTAIGPDIVVPVIAPGVSFAFSPLWDSLNKAGKHTLFAVVDPNNTQTEMSELDNKASVNVTVLSAAAGIDLAIATPDITLIPAQPARLPSTLGIAATVRNIGMSDALGVHVLLLTGPAGNQTIGADTVVDILNRSSVAVNFSYLLTTAGTTNFTVQVDPNNLITETNKANNTATASVSTAPSVDLAVSNADISVDKNPALVGDDVTFKITLHNNGTVDAPAAAVVYTVTDGNTTQTLWTNTVQLPAGQSTVQTVTWRVNLTGTVNFSAQLDPAALIPEADKTNNTGTLSISTGVANGPNLVVTYKDLSFAPVLGLEGHDVVLSAIIRNTGSTSASNIPVSFYLGDPSTGTLLGSATIVTLAPNTSSTVTTTWTAVPNPGDKLLFVVVDPANTITEFSKTDNSAFNVLTVLSLPDLAVTTGDITFTPGFPRAGDTLTITAQVNNLGDQAAANVVVRAFDGDPAAGGAQIGADQIIPNIAGHSTSAVNFNLTLVAASATRPIVIQVDPANLILERNKTNNTTQRDLAVQDGNFYVSNLYFSPNGDGVKDTTEFFFRLGGASNLHVDAVDKRNAVVRRFSGGALNNTAANSVVWDGLDDLGRLVQDGPYKLRVSDSSGAVAGEVKVILDTNRSSLLDAAETKYGSFRNLTCDIPIYENFLITQDDEKIFLTTSMSNNRTTIPYFNGVFSINGAGGDIRSLADNLLPFVNSPTNPQYTIANDLVIAPDGSHIGFKRFNGADATLNSEWIMDGNGKNPYQITGAPSTLWNNADRKMSNDGKVVYEIYRDAADNYNFKIISTSTVAGSVGQIIYNGASLAANGYDYYFSPDVTKVILVFYGDHSIHLIDLKTGQDTLLPASITAPFYYYNYISNVIAWSPDSQRFVLLDNAAHKILVLNQNGITLQTYDAPITADISWTAISLKSPTWSSSNHEFAVGANRIIDECANGLDGRLIEGGGIYTIDLDTRKLTKVANFASYVARNYGCYSYHISTWDGAQWQERGVLHYGMYYQEKRVDLSKYLQASGGKYRVRLHQVGQEAAHVDDVSLVVDGRRLAPVSALHLGTQQDILNKVVARDNEVAALHEAEMEVAWDVQPGARIELALGANEESFSKRTDLIPFSYPAEAGRVYNYVVSGDRPMVVDGKQTAQDNLIDPLFKVYSRPNTGHPASNVYGYVQSDAQYLYAALDFTVDNDEDDSDWADLRINTKNGWKTYRVTAKDSTNGMVAFVQTGKVSYTHKYYEFKVALTDIGASIGDTLEIAFHAYGSAAMINSSSQIDLINNNDIYWIPGERSLLYRNYSYYYNNINNFSYAQDLIGIRLDEQNRMSPIFTGMYDSFATQVNNFRFSPTGRQMLFTSSKDAYDPSSRCYNQGSQDTFSFKSLLNLTADLRAIRSTSGGIRLEGTASDLNFSSYQLEYANADTPAQWQPVVPASNTPILDDLFTTWVPPAAGSYFIRLTVQDLAGNTRQTIQRVSWSDTPGITDLYRTPAIISPNGDGIQDTATIHYRVLDPVHLEFNFYNKTGDRVRTIVRDHSVTGVEANVIWDGRDDKGLPVADGVYRMTVQNYEFYITVDTTLPVTKLTLSDAYQPLVVTSIDPGTGQQTTRSLVNVVPSLSWNVTDINYASSLVETGSGANPLTWTEFYNPDPVETGKGGLQPKGCLNCPPLALDLDKFVNQSFKLTAHDAAGNQTIITVGPGKEELIVARIGNFEINPVISKWIKDQQTKGKAYDPVAFQALVAYNGLFKLIDNVLYVPMAQQDGGTGLSTTLAPTQARLAVVETITSPLAQIFVQYRKPATSVWSEKAITGTAISKVDVPQLLTTPSIPNHTMDAVWDLAGLEGGQRYVVRLRALDASGVEHISNSFQVAIGGYSFKGWITSANDPVAWGQFIAPLLKTPLGSDEYVLWGDEKLSTPISEVQLYAHSSDDARYAADRLVDTFAYPDGTFIFRTKELQSCMHYTGYIVLYGEPDVYGVKPELGRTGSVPFTVPCLKLSTDVQVQFASNCGDSSPNQVKIRLAPTTLASDAPLKLLTLSHQIPVVGKDIVFNVNQPTSVPKPADENGYYPYEYTLDTSALPDGALQYQAELTNINDEVVTRDITVIVDHTPPVVDITYPHEAQGVCGVPVVGKDGKTRNVVTLEGTISDANGLHYEMDSSTTGETTLSLFHKSRSYYAYNSIAKANGEADPKLADRSKFHLAMPFSGPLSAVFDQTGTLTTRLRVYDWGGHQQCVTRTFQFDGAVVGTSETLDRAIMSPNGDGVADSVVITYAVDEPAKVDIDVYQATGPDANGQMQLIGSSLRSIGKQLTTLAGTSNSEWDGRDDAGSVVLDGKYGIQITFTDNCGNVAKLVRYVEVDNTPPAISVAYPTSTSQLPLIVEVQGAIDDLHLQGYTIDYGVGAAPDAWIRLKSGASNVSSGVIVPWNTYGLTGAYTLRVIGIDAAGNQRTVLIPVNLQTRLNIISALEATPTPFSPNGDGRRESTAIRVSLDQDAAITLAVQDAQGAIRRTLATTQSTLKGSSTFNWDGKDGAAQLLPDGVYTIGLLATLTSDPLVKQDEKITVVLDATMPLVDITRPVNGFVTATGGVMGSITDLHLTSYTVSLTNSPAAPVWNVLDSGTLVRSNAVLGSLAGLPEGSYAIRVEAQDDAENKVDRVIPFSVDNTPPKVDISAPADGSMLGIKKVAVNILGTLDEKNLKSYTLDYGSGTAPTTWTTLAGGTSLPLPAVLKVWDVTTVPDGVYTLRFRAIDQAGLIGEKRISITVDNTAPTVAVTAPVDGSYVRQPLDVSGSVVDTNLASYLLEIAPGAKGTSTRWSDIGAGTAPVTSGKLISWQALPPDGVYTVRLAAKDKADNYSETLVQLTVDTQPPAKPTGLKAVIQNRQDVQLTWTANTEPDLAGYAVYRDGTRITTATVLVANYIDLTVAEGQHVYTITALDKAGWESTQSDPANVTVDITPPTTRIQSPASATTASGLVDIKGTAYSVSDFKEYRLYSAPSSAPANRLLLRRSPVPIQSDVLFQWNTLGLVEGAGYIITLETEDINGNVGTDQASVVIDNLPPAAPTGLVATPTAANVQLNWNPNSETDLLGYLVFRNGRLANVVGTLVGDLRPYAVAAAQYPDANLADGPYTYLVYAIDKAGNLSAPSNGAQVTIDTHPPHTIITQPAVNAKFDTPQYVLATSPDIDIAAVQFQYRLAASTTWINLGTPVTTLPYATNFDPVKLGLVYGAYQLQSVATDLAAHIDPAPASITVNYIDVTRPSMTLGLKSKVNGGDVSLTWTANTETDLAGYYIDRRSDTGTTVRITATPVATVNYVDASVADGNYHYTVTAVDQTGNLADPSAETVAKVYTPVVVQPYTPTKNAVVNVQGKGDPASIVNATVLTSAGTASLPSLNSDATGNFNWSGLPLVAGDNVFSVNLTDAVGNISKTTTTTVIFGTAPSQPTGLTASATGYNVTLNWTANPETNILGYRVFRNTLSLLPLTTVTGLSASASSARSYAPPTNTVDGVNDPAYPYWAPNVLPQSLDGEWLAVSSVMSRLITRINLAWGGYYGVCYYCATDYDLQAWSGQGWVTIKEVRNNKDFINSIDLPEAYLTNQLRILLHSALYPSQGDPVRLVEVSVLYEPLQTTTIFNETAPDGNHDYTVTAVNNYGFESIPSAQAKLAVGDVTAPDPVTLSASVFGSDVTLIWTASASTDTTHYALYRDGTLISTITDLTNLKYVDTGRPNGIYHYTVTALDAANNQSVASNIVTATVAVALLPAPVNLVVSAVPAGGALDLAWTPSAGQIPAGYRVLRTTVAGGPYQPVTDTVSTQQRDTGLTNGTTYFYVVAALDAFGNAGVLSNEASGLPQDKTAPVVTMHYPTLAGKIYKTADAFTNVVGRTEPGAMVKLYQNGYLAGQAQARVTDEVLAISSGLLSPDGQYTVTSTNNTLVLHSIATQTDTRIFSNSGNVYGYDWTADSSQIIYDYWDSTTNTNVISAYHIADQTNRKLLSPGYSNNINRFALAPNQTQLAIVGTNQTGTYGFWVIDLSNGTWRAIPTSMVNIAGIQWSPDSTRIAINYSYPTYQDAVIHVATGIETIIDTQAGYATPQWSPDGSVVLFTSLRDGTEQVWKWAVADGTSVAITKGTMKNSDPSWSPDGQSIIYYKSVANTYVYTPVILDMVSGVAHEITGYTSITWVNSGYLYAQNTNGYYRVNPAGRIEFKGLPLTPGDNIFNASATDVSGNIGASSASMVVNYNVNDRPDLVVTDSDITILPAVPLANETTRITMVVKNQGSVASPFAAVSLIMVDPAGAMTTLLDGNLLSPITAGGSQVLVADWTAPTLAGDYSIVAVVDPQDQVPEVSEANNLAIRTVHIAGAAKPEARIVTDKQAYLPAETVQVTAAVINSGDTFTGRVEVAIEDTAGYLVQKLATQDVVALPYAQSVNLANNWNTGKTFAGDYQAHVSVFDTANQPVSDARTAFSIGSASTLTSTLTTDRAVYAANSNVHVAATFSYGGNAVITGAQRVLRIQNASGVVQTQDQQVMGDLLPGATGTAALDWKNGAAAPGSYQAILEISNNGVLLSTASTAFSIQASTNLVSGKLTLTEQAPAAGTAQTVNFTVSNLGNTPLTQVPLHITLVDPDLQSTLQMQQAVQDIAVGAQATGNVVLTTAGLQLKTYTVVLSADVPDANGATVTATLASVSFPVVDRTPPNVVLRQPTVNGFSRGDATETIFAKDDLSLVKTVEVSVDGAAWVAVPVSNAAQNLFGGVLQGLAEGVHTIAARATDAWNNTGSTSVSSFTVDNTPPVIAITGIADAQYYKTDVIPNVIVTDANLDKAILTLNNVAYISATPVQTEGIYNLAVLATDKAGNSAQQTLHFVVDKTAPAVVISGVQDNGFYNVDVVPVIQITDTNLTASTITLNGQPFVSGTTVIAEGVYQLTVTAADAAGNVTSTLTKFTIDKTPPIITITSPLDGATVTVNAIDVKGSTEAGASVSLSVGTYKNTLVADSQGLFTFVQIPLVAGTNAISVNARDQAGNTGSTVIVTLQVVTGEVHEELMNNGRVLVWLPAKLNQDCVARMSGNPQATGSGFRMVGYDTDCTGPGSGANSGDPYAQFIALIDSTFRSAEADYLVVRTKDDFINAIRSRRYTTILLGELQTATGAESLSIDDAMAEEIQATVASGVGLAWIKTHPDNITNPGNDKPDWDRFFGVTTTGVILNLTQVVLTGSVASQAGTWATSGFGLQVQAQGGSAVGSLIPDNAHPAMVLNRHGNGNVALVTFDPSAFVDPQGAIDTLHNIVMYAVPVTTTPLPSALTEIRWDTSKLNPPIDVRFEAHLPIGMSFLELDGGQILSAQEAIWDRHLDVDHTSFSALLRLPSAIGAYDVNATLSQQQGVDYSPLVSKTLTVNVTTNREQLGIAVMDTLNSLVVAPGEQKTLDNAIVNVQQALIRQQIITDDIKFSIEELMHAEILIASLAGDHTELLSKIGLLMTTYQLAWVESIN